jgi:glucose-6-phosphate isomerase
VPDGTHIVGLPDWIEQLVAESTGKKGTGILPVVLLPVSPEVEQTPADLQILRLVDDAVHFQIIEQHPDEILISGSLGAAVVVWEYATAIAGRLLGIDPFDQPDVESAKEAARGSSTRAPPRSPALHGDDVEVRVSDAALAASGTRRAFSTRSGLASAQADTSRSRPTSIAPPCRSSRTSRARRRR